MPWSRERESLTMTFNAPKPQYELDSNGKLIQKKPTKKAAPAKKPPTQYKPKPKQYDPGRHWYEVENGSFPHMSVNECSVCKRSVQPGQVVYIDKKQARAGSTYEPWFVMHKECMMDALNAAPMSEFDRIQERLKSGGSLF